MSNLLTVVPFLTNKSDTMNPLSRPGSLLPPQLFALTRSLNLNLNLNPILSSSQAAGPTPTCWRWPDPAPAPASDPYPT
jgi:hypothetical protein